MDELGLDAQSIACWFSHTRAKTYDLVRVSQDHVTSWAETLTIPFRRCYVTDTALDSNARRLGVPAVEILSAKLPDPGPTMAGDFGEIITYLYHTTRGHPARVFGPKKWRLKQDRTKPAPLSDVIQFVLPEWPTPSEQDILLCSEVKTKSTTTASAPITSAIADCTKDRTSRLARTLVWLRERAMGEELGDVTLDHLNRFINAVDHPPATKQFFAVVVICSSLIDGELASVPSVASDDFTLVIVSIPQLYATYMSVFERLRQPVADGRS